MLEGDSVLDDGPFDVVVDGPWPSGVELLQLVRTSPTVRTVAARRTSKSSHITLQPIPHRTPHALNLGPSRDAGRSAYAAQAMGLLRHITHPNVAIDPAVAVPHWSLSELGRQRIMAMLGQSWVPGISRIVSSAETKAVETATILAGHLRLEIEVRAGSGETDRSATGFVPPGRIADQSSSRPVGTGSLLDARPQQREPCSTDGARSTTSLGHQREAQVGTGVAISTSAPFGSST